MSKDQPELEPDAPNWSDETASDDLLAEQLQEKGLDMSEVQDPDAQTSGVGPAPDEEEAPADSPGTPAPDTSPPEEQEGENGNGDEEDGA